MLQGRLGARLFGIFKAGAVVGVAGCGGTYPWMLPACLTANSGAAGCVAWAAETVAFGRAVAFGSEGVCGWLEGVADPAT